MNSHFSNFSLSGYVFCRSDKDGKYQRGFKKVVNQKVHKDRMETINSGNIQLMLGCIKSDIEETTKILHCGGCRSFAALG